MERILSQFHLIHINAPGQEVEALLLPECFKYPSMEKLAEQVQDVVEEIIIFVLLEWYNTHSRGTSIHLRVKNQYIQK